MSDARGRLARALYGAVFCVALPAALVLWAARLEPAVALPALRWPVIGVAVLAAAGLLWSWAVWSLWVYARGLPMNAFPPRELVSRGPFAWLNHPIYVAFVGACAGVSLAVGSAAGFWVVTPLAAMGCTALVLGYENRALATRFPGTRRRPRLALPPPVDRPPTAWERASVFVLVFAPWLALYEAVGHLPVVHPVQVLLPGEREWPVWVWAELPYASTYLLVVAVPLLTQRAAALRRFAISGLVATAAVSLLYVTVPVVSPPRGFQGDGALSALLSWERSDGLDGRAAFPAFHLLWAMLAASALAAGSRWRGIVVWLWVAVIAVSCVLTGMHAVLDVVAAMAIYPAISRSIFIYERLRRACERLCNGWREWRLGRIRVINYAAFAGASALVGSLVIGSLAGPGGEVDVAIVSITALVGAALWGQYWVGSTTTVLRPFGYFGSVLGAGAAILMIALWRGVDAFWPLLGAAAIAAPWVQGIGRLRCLVNGCCHGAPCDPAIGIVCTHPRSRIVRLSGLGGRAIHPTPLYSILSNLVIGLLMWRLCRSAVTPPLIAGCYLVLAGLARFVEESLRGEPHTPTYAGLRLYQWCAMVMVAAGMVTAACRTGVPMPAPALTSGVWVSSLLIAAVYAFAMGIDFPESTRRFSRLT